MSRFACRESKAHPPADEHDEDDEQQDGDGGDDPGQDAGVHFVHLLGLRGKGPQRVTLPAQGHPLDRGRL